jgi:hypothetical protein
MTLHRANWPLISQPACSLLAHVYTAGGAVRAQGHHRTYNLYNREQAELNLGPSKLRAASATWLINVKCGTKRLHVMSDYPFYMSERSFYETANCICVTFQDGSTKNDPLHNMSLLAKVMVINWLFFSFKDAFWIAKSFVATNIRMICQLRRAKTYEVYVVVYCLFSFICKEWKKTPWISIKNKMLQCICNFNTLGCEC